VPIIGIKGSEMDISELVFTTLGPILYNIIFISLWILWFIYHNDEEDQRLKKGFNKYLKEDKWFYSLTIILIVIFLYFLLSYAIWHTDVDDAITSAVQAFLNGDNPYQEKIVKHITPEGPVLGFYHYFPPDLITYSLVYVIISPIFLPILDTYWFVPFHLVLLVPGFWIVRRLVNWPIHRIVPFFVLLVTPFLFTNSMLMWFFFLLGYYFYEEKSRTIIGMVFYVLAASVKYMVGFIIVFYFFQALGRINEKGIITKNWSYVWQQIFPYIVSSGVLFLISLPFGLIDVIISVFIYQGAISYRGEVAQTSGPLLIEILNLFGLNSIYLLIVGIIVILAYFSLRTHSTYEKILHFSFLAMIILPFYATELFITLPFFWWFKEGNKMINDVNKEGKSL
jgi:hypothetical protein